MKQSKPADNFYRLNNHFKVVMDGLTIWADGAMKPTTEDEAHCAKAILAKAASLIIQFARLGIDIEGIYKTFYKGDNENEKKQHNQIEFNP